MPSTNTTSWTSPVYEESGQSLQNLSVRRSKVAFEQEAASSIVCLPMSHLRNALSCFAELSM